MTSTIKEHRNYITSTISYFIDKFGDNRKYSIYDNRSFLGVKTIGNYFSHDERDSVEFDTIVCLWKDCKDNIYCRTISNQVYMLDNLSTDDIDSLYLIMVALNFSYNLRKVCGEWYKNFFNDFED